MDKTQELFMGVGRRLPDLLNNLGFDTIIHRSNNDIVWELTNAGIITDGKLWMQKCAEDKNVYWLCYKMANKLRGTL